MRNHSTLIFALLVTLAGSIAGYAIWQSSDDAPQADQSLSTAMSAERDDAQPSQADTSDSDTAPATGSTDKPSQAEVSVLKEPVVYTGYGHSASNPLPKNQQTSTTCTTDAGVECFIRFTNQSSGDIVEFDAQTTDAQGVAYWRWSGGVEVGSGTWDVVAISGEASSAKEVIYVE